MREIDRNPTTPQLSAKAIQLITELCFRHDDILKPVDGLFIFSSLVDLQKEVDLIEKVLQQGFTKNVFITGGLINKERAGELGMSEDVIEADLIPQYLDVNKYKDINFYYEKQSKNTLENVTESLKNPEFKNCKTLILIFKSHGAGRGYLTLRKFFPMAEILQATYDVLYENQDNVISRNTWPDFEFTKSRVWGEYLRIQKYASRGDIEYKSVEKLLKQIETEV
ncbi:MAG: ElyC/SanA/YdcF family protein [Candidatus Falkowbacteria bacterium]